MIKKYISEKTLLFDGSESEMLTRTFDINSDILIKETIGLEDFTKNDFKDLKHEMDESDYEKILKTGHFSKDEGFLHLDKGSDDLKLYFCKRDNIIMVFAYGEFQPTRYKLYLEGIWVID